MSGEPEYEGDGEYDGSDPYAMFLQHRDLDEAGVLEPDQPTLYGHYCYQRAVREWVDAEPAERVAFTECVLLAPVAPDTASEPTTHQFEIGHWESDGVKCRRCGLGEIAHANEPTT